MSEVLNGVQFLRPWWLALLVLVPLVCALHLWRIRTRGEWHRVVDQSLLDVLVEKREAKRSRLSLAALIAAMVLASLAMAGPAWKALPTPVYEQVDNLVIALDLSLSMQIQDTPPSRLDVAKRKIIDVLRMRDEGQTALIVFAGDAHVVTPLSDDSATLLNLLEPLDPVLMPLPGSQTGHALQLAAEVLDNVGAQSGRILLLTDGIERLADFSKHSRASYSISILGVGTPEGGPIPTYGRDGSIVYHENQGQVVRESVDTARLQQAARMVAGRFRMASVDDSDLQYLMGDGGGAKETLISERSFDIFQDAGYWFLIPLLVLGAAAMRRGVLVALCLVIAPLSDASWVDDLWKRRDQQGFEALRNGDYETAIELFESLDWRAVTHYRAEELEEAEAGFLDLNTIEGTFNAGNALSLQGKLEEAIKTYDAVLETSPSHSDAKFNRDLLAKFLRERLQQQQNNASQPGSATQGEGPRVEANSAGSIAGNLDEQRSSEQKGEPGPAPTEDYLYDPDWEDSESSEKQDIDAEQEGDRSESDEQVAVVLPQTALERKEAEAALDRWMRSLPDSRNLLLYNKFRLESQRRIDAGEYRPSQEGNPW